MEALIDYITTISCPKVVTFFNIILEIMLKRTALSALIHSPLRKLPPLFPPYELD